MPVLTAPRVERGTANLAAGRAPAGPDPKTRKVLPGVAIVTRGEALGHGSWLDGAFLRQVADAINAAPAGIKSRFAHPLLTDGIGTFLGRVKNARVDGDVVRGDLNLFATAHDTPDGDLAGYVMRLAEEDPTAFGLSISFLRDIDAEGEFLAANSRRGRFASPDQRNVESYPHVRLKTLLAADVVDQPAANPAGLYAAKGSTALPAAKTMPPVSDPELYQRLIKVGYSESQARLAANLKTARGRRNGPVDPSRYAHLGNLAALAAHNAASLRNYSVRSTTIKEK